MSTVREIIGMKEAKPFKSKLTPATCCNPDQLVGLEIETEGCQQTMEWYMVTLGKLWETKTDGSLRGINNGQVYPGNAFEFISKPAGIGVTLAELVEFWKSTGFTNANYSDRCSIHVHTNVQDMTPEQVATLCLVYSVVEEVLFEFINHYGVTEVSKYRDTGVYCVPWNQCRMNHQMVTNMFADLDYSFRNWQKYTALNIIPARTLGTVEWRHMHGTANMDKITKWLNIIGSILLYAKTREFSEVVKILTALNDNSAYRQFYTDVLQDYLPYEDKYAAAISSGVVNAKYALIGLKADYKVNIKPKAAKASMYEQAFEDLRREAGQVRAADVNAAGAGAIPAQWAQVAQVDVEVPLRGGNGELPRRNPFLEPRVGGVEAVVTQAVNPLRADRLETDGERIIRQARERRENAFYLNATYPLETGTLNRIANRARGVRPRVDRGLRDAAGRLYWFNGEREPNQTTFRGDTPLAPTYVAGVGASYWQIVDEAYRRPQPVQERDDI
jgi:hypothetical protein